MTDRDTPCVVCGSVSENFDPNFCSSDCFDKWEEDPALYDLHTTEWDDGHPILNPPGVKA